MQDNESTVNGLDTTPEEVQEEIVYTKPAVRTYISSDKMELNVEIERTSTHTLDPVLEDVMEAVTAAGVTWGINEKAARSLCSPPTFNTAVTVARGKKPEIGSDGYLNYLVEAERRLQPKERPDGTVDYRDLGFIQTVQSGQSLCEIYPAQKGADGMDIFGEVVEGIFGKSPSDPAGKNTAYNEEKTLLLASCDGSVEVKNKIISVIELLRVNGNIDNSTGDIVFPGDIIISGDVISGFNVTSTNGSIAIKGGVDGANVTAGEDININSGINGMDRGVITAGGSLKCKYINGCYVKVGKDIFTETVMNATIECGGNIDMVGTKSRIIGGRTTVAGFLRAGRLGASSHVATIVAINSGAELDKEIKELGEKIKDIDAQNIKLQQLFARFEDLRQKGKLTPEMIPTLQTARNGYAGLVKSRNETVERIAAAKAELLELQINAQNSYIQCKGRIHTGVSISFGPLTMQVHQSFENSRVCIVDGEIKVMNL